MEKIGQSYGIAIQSLQKDSSPSKSILFFYSPKIPQRAIKSSNMIPLWYVSIRIKNQPHPYNSKAN